MLPTEKLETLERRFDELQHLLCSPEVLTDHNKLQKLNTERTELEQVVNAYARLKQKNKELKEASEMIEDADLKDVAADEVARLNVEIPQLASELELLLLPRDPNDEKNTILEIRSGEGGEEAALFAADLFRMICRYAEGKRWRVEGLNTTEASRRGDKEGVALVPGRSGYSHPRSHG